MERIKDTVYYHIHFTRTKFSFEIISYTVIARYHTENAVEIFRDIILNDDYTF